MPEYEQSLTVHAAPDAVFDFIADVHNMPKYLPTVKHAEPEEGERVHMEGDAKGHHYDSDGHLHADHAALRLEWGSDGEHAYSGWMQVGDAGDGQSQVTVHLSFAPPPHISANLEKSTGDRDATINEELQTALQSIQNEVEGKGGKVPSLQEQ